MNPAKIFIIAATIIILISTFVYLNTLKYTVTNITADNYTKKISRNTKESLTEVGQVASAIFSDPYIFYTAKKFSSFP